MADSTSPIQQIAAGSNAVDRVNENFDAASPALMYGRDARTTAGLTWGYVGGRWGGAAIASSTVGLTASTTNYVVVNRSTGAVSVSTANTNWNNTATYARAYLVVTGAASVTSYQDHRAGAGGLDAPLPADFDAAVRAVPLTGLSTATSAAIDAADTLLAALGKLQAQITTLDGAAVKTTGAQSVAGVKTFTDVLRVANGTAAAPSIAAASDANTGLRWPSAGRLGFVAAGADQAYVSTRGVIAAAGKVLAVTLSGVDEFRLDGGAGLTYKPPASSWARGWFVRDTGDTADAAGFGFLGQGVTNTVTSYHVGFTGTWWSGSILTVRPTSVDITMPLRLGQYTLTTLPSASAFSGYFIDVTNATGGPKLCRSNGTVWQIANTTTTVS